MNTTRPSLLLDVRNPENRVAWDRFDGIYRPLIARQCLSRGLQPADAEDVAQSVLLQVQCKIREFAYDPAKGTFRGWLFRVTMTRIHDFRRRQESRRQHLEQLRSQFRDRGTEQLVEVREHLEGQRPGETNEAPLPAPSGTPAEEDQAWIDAFQVHLFRAAFQLLREEKKLSQQEMRVIELWWEDRRAGPQRARIELGLTIGREAVIRSKAIKRLKEKMLELGEDLPWLQME